MARLQGLQLQRANTSTQPNNRQAVELTYIMICNQLCVRAVARLCSLASDPASVPVSQPKVEVILSEVIQSLVGGRDFKITPLSSGYDISLHVRVNTDHQGATLPVDSTLMEASETNHLLQ